MTSEGFTASEIDAMDDRIAATFSGKTVLITGGTGFMGKVLVEKLLRMLLELTRTLLSSKAQRLRMVVWKQPTRASANMPEALQERDSPINTLNAKCPDIGNIMLLVRTKKGKNPKQRLEEIFNGPLFEKVRNLRGGVEPLLAKMSTVPGDCQLPELGMSEQDRQLAMDSVDIIIHAAATIRFDEELKKAVLLNVRGTKLMVELGKKCKKLELFIHISTAYCHLHEKLLEEKPYPPPADPHHIIQAMEWMDDETIAAVTPKLLNKLPNSYAFTKALGEALVVEAMGQGLPGMVLRPSIVIPIWQEPVPGWTDNINGPTGLLIGAGKGVIRTMYCKSNSYADYLPVDVFINGIMIAAWNYITYGDKEANVMNFTSSAEIKVTWSEMIDAGREIIMNRVPLNGVVWYPGGSMKHSRLLHNICVLFFHWIPALFLDMLLFCLGYKPVLCRVQRRITKGFEVFEYYTNNQWDFKSDIAQYVRQRLNTRERRDYKVDAIGLDISNYFEHCIRSARVFILKEYDDTLPAARRHMKVMWFVDLVVRCLFWGYLLWCVYGWTSAIFSSVLGSTPDEMVTPTIMNS